VGYYGHDNDNDNDGLEIGSILEPVKNHDDDDDHDDGNPTLDIRERPGLVKR
jgi:hypothetical protein